MMREKPEKSNHDIMKYYMNKKYIAFRKAKNQKTFTVKELNEMMKYILSSMECSRKEHNKEAQEFANYVLCKLEK